MAVSSRLPPWRTSTPVTAATMPGRSAPRAVTATCGIPSHASFALVSDQKVEQQWETPGYEEIARIWNLFVQDRAWYADYQARTERRIPLVRLPETRPA